MNSSVQGSSHSNLLWLESWFEFHQQQSSFGLVVWSLSWVFVNRLALVAWNSDFLLPTLNFVIVVSSLPIANKLETKCFRIQSFHISLRQVGFFYPLSSMIIHAAVLAKYYV